MSVGLIEEKCNKKRKLFCNYQNVILSLVLMFLKVLYKLSTYM